jgi:hypothetical protein
MTTSDVPSNELLQNLGVEYQFRVTILEALQIPMEYEDIFCQFNFLHQHHEAYSTEPIKNPSKADVPLVLSHIQNVNFQFSNNRKLFFSDFSSVLLSRVHFWIIFVLNLFFSK